MGLLGLASPGLAQQATLNLAELDGSNGFATSRGGLQVSGVGEVNGSGYDDIVIGAIYADPNGVSGAGQSYVVFGGNEAGESGVIELSELDGIKDLDNSGYSVSGTNDVDGGGVDDLVIGATDQINGLGQSYIVFGQPSAIPPLPLSTRTALANCLIEAGLTASAAVATSQKRCAQTAGTWEAEVRVPGDKGNCLSGAQASRC